MKHYRDHKRPDHYITVVGKKAFVELTNGQTAVIDAADVPLVHHRLWQAKFRCGIWYAVSSKEGPMHRTIMGLAEGESPEVFIDHIDGNGLNNCRDNLRTCENRENLRNSKKRTVAGRKPLSRFKGVTKCSGQRGWRAQIMRDGVKVNLGNYATEEMAARVYDMAAREYFGKFARTNFEEAA